MANNLETFHSSADKIVPDFKKEVSGIRTNRPTTALVENLKVDCYGQSLAINATGTISILPPRTIQIQVWDKGLVKDVAHAIEASSLNLSANIDGNTIRVNLPELSTERREELIKHLKKISETYRIQLRHVRDEANKAVERMLDAKEINEDQKFSLREEIQKKVDAVNAEIERALEAKIKEINE